MVPAQTEAKISSFTAFSTDILFLLISPLSGEGDKGESGVNASQYIAIATMVQMVAKMVQVMPIVANPDHFLSFHYKVIAIEVPDHLQVKAGQCSYFL
jgi:hypothetical protein